MPEFVEWGKIYRLFRPVIVTEKIDGTNAAIGVTDDGEVYAQSRKKIITPGKQTDNFGFAAFVAERADAIREKLGPGLHFGEWYGKGIQRGYGLDERRFALFNVKRWEGVWDLPDGVGTVPLLYEGDFSEERVRNAVDRMRHLGSLLPGAEGFKAEGVVVYHVPANTAFKVLVEGDELPKSVTNA